MIYKKFRLDINGLRAFALISVVLYHFGVPYVSHLARTQYRLYFFIQIIITQFTLVISTHHQSSTFCFTPGHYQLSGNFIFYILY